MPDLAPAASAAPPGPAISLRWRVVLTFATAIVTAFVAGSAFLYEEALESRHEIAHRAVAAAAATSGAFDREVAATGYLLQGLSRSPALKSGDLRAFHDQLVETPRPSGAWFVLWDHERQLLNTVRPFGGKTPQRAFGGIGGETWNRIRERRISVTDRPGPRRPSSAVSVHLRLDGPDGNMVAVLTTAIPVARLNAVVRRDPLPPGWTTTVLDHEGTPIATSDPLAAAPQAIPPELRQRLREVRGPVHFTAFDGTRHAIVAAHRSAETDYMAITSVPTALANAPVDAALSRIGAAGALVLLAGAFAGLFVVRQVAPVEKSAASTARRLRLAEARYASLWYDTSESLFVVQVMEDGRFVFEGLNPAHERATGLTAEMITGMEPEECLSPETAAAVLARYRHVVATGKPEIYDEVLLLPGGRRHWQTSLAPVRDPDTGRICLLVGTARDVTDDREARAQIEHSHRLLQATVDALSAHIAILDGSGTIIAENKAWDRFAGSGGQPVLEHGVGRNYLEICRAAAAAHGCFEGVVGEVEAVLRGGEAMRRTSYEFDGRSFQMCVARFSHSGAAHVVVAHEDITDLRSAQKDVRRIADRLLSLQEEERQRIAADLHDSTAQHIVAAGLALMHVKAVAGDRKRVEEAVGAVRASLDEAQKEIRTLSYLLYPPHLRTNGLAASVRQFVEGFTRRTGLDGTAEVVGDVDRAPIEVQRSILRVVQEALVNVHRHAEAARVHVVLKLDGAGLRLRISDDGKGLGASLDPSRPVDPPRPSPPLGVGIPGMEARIRQFGGSLKISTGKEGTTIRALIPLSAFCESAEEEAA
jgi:PAS domain S-box-containing protein